MMSSRSKKTSKQAKVKDAVAENTVEEEVDKKPASKKPAPTRSTADPNAHHSTKYLLTVECPSNEEDGNLSDHDVESGVNTSNNDMPEGDTNEEVLFLPRPPRQEQQPGAFAVQGPDASDGEDDEYTVTNQSHTVNDSTTNTPSSRDEAAVTVEARLVEGEEDVVEGLQEELQQRNEELEQLRRERENVVVAEVVPNNQDEDPPIDLEENNAPKPSWLKRPRAKWILLAIFCVVVAVIVVSVVLSRNAPEGQESLAALLSSVSLDGGTALQTPSTPQNKAYEWLKGNANLETYSDGRKVQRYVLATLYFSTNGDSWKNNTGWLSDSDECLWHNRADNAFCSSGGAVVELNLFFNNLVGTIPAEIALLSNSADEVQFENNGLTGTIPTEIALLTELRFLSLGYNALSGTIPSEIGLLTKLTSCWLNVIDDLAGTIPSEIGLLTVLSSLSLFVNKLRGPIPSEIALMTDLNLMNLRDNDLSGSIPSEIGLLTKLDRLYLYNNSFSGDFICPTFIESCYVSCRDQDTHDLNSPCRTL